MRRWKEDLVRRLLEGYDTDVEPPLTSGESNTTVLLNINILCASLSSLDYVHIEAWLRMVGIQYTVLQSIGLCKKHTCSSHLVCYRSTEKNSCFCFLARSANLPEGLYIVSYFFLFLTLVLQWYFLKRTLQLGVFYSQVYLRFCVT